jgi:hypothetical protein
MIASPLPDVAMIRVALARSPVRHQAIARTIRPPSSGSPGSRLNASSSALMKQMSASTTSVGVRSVRLNSIALVKASTPAVAAPMAKTIKAISAVASGPAAEILKSIHGVGESRFMRASPPNIQRSIPMIPTPLRRAAIACPSSCRRIDRKNASAKTTARMNARSSWPGNWFLYASDLK